MHPAPSIIAFTTLSGLGYGLAAVLGLGLLDAGAIATKIAHVLALVLIGGGLMSSTLHLGNPQRAWRAFSQWRSSWLSREGLMAIITFVPLCVSAWLSLFQGAYSPVAGLFGSVLAAVTVYCTAMIYASLKSVDAWHTPLTPACYLAFAGAGGSLFATFAALGGGSVHTARFLIATALVIALAWAIKMSWWRRARSMTATSTAESATGLGHIGRVRLLERPHGTENYLTREMGFRVARKHAAKLGRLAVIYGGIIPAAILIVIAFGGPGAPALVGMLAAIVLFGLGIVVERWLFFAEARHAVMSYYGG